MATDAELIASAQRGSEEALEALFRRWPRAWQWAYALTGKRERADDLAQEAFLRASAHFRASTPSGPSARGSSASFSRVLIERFVLASRTWRTVLSLVLDDTGRKEGVRIPVVNGTTVRAHLPLPQAKPCYLAGYSMLIRT